MAVTDPYATVDELESRASKIDSDGLSSDANIELDIMAASEFIDEHTHRSFNLIDEDPMSPHTETFNLPEFPGRSWQYIGDYAVVATVSLDGDVLVEGTDYTLRHGEDNPRFPYAWIDFPTSQVGTIQVTGQRGWLAVPSIIKLMTIRLALINRFEEPLAFVHRDTGEDMASQKAQALFDQYLAAYVNKEKYWVASART